MSAYKAYNVTKVNPLVALVALIGFFFLFGWVAKGIFKILSLVAPILLIAAAIINYRVILGYGKWLMNLLRKNPLFGVGAVVFSLIAFPLVSAFLLFKALTSNKIDDMTRPGRGQYISYEEVNEDFLDISEVKNQKKNIESEYDDLLK